MQLQQALHLLYHLSVPLCCLRLLTERMFRQEIIIKMPDGTTQSVVRSLDRLERKLGSRLFRRIFRTITVDNGSEFADC